MLVTLNLKDFKKGIKSCILLYALLYRKFSSLRIQQCAERDKLGANSPVVLVLYYQSIIPLLKKLSDEFIYLVFSLYLQVTYDIDFIDS